MASITFSNVQLISATNQLKPLHLSEGTLVTFSEISLPKLEQLNPSDIIKESR